MAEAPKNVPDFFATVFTVEAFAAFIPVGRIEAAAPMAHQDATFTNLFCATNFLPCLKFISMAEVKR